MNKFIVITENDVSNWEDETGTRYHFPNRYQRFLLPGTQIIYYKGRLRDKSFELQRLSSEPHYFGIGKIGKVWRESRDSSNYFAEILEYIRFNKAVPFKDKSGKYLEQIPESKKSNYWRDAVRPVDKEFFDLIVELGLESQIIKHLESKTKEYLYPDEPPPELSDEELLMWYEAKNMLVRDSFNEIRYSQESKKIGDHGEQIVIKYLQSLGKEVQKDSIIWHAKIGETPGYDISYLDENGEQVCVEVKSTTGKKFMNFIMTSNEIESAKELKNKYKIFLVADCLSQKPKIKVIDNPTQDRVYNFTAIAYKVFRKKENDT